PLIAAVEIKVFLDALLPAESSGMRLLYATGLVALLACLNLQGRDLPRLAQTAIFLALVLISLGLSSLALTQPAAATVALERASHGHDAASLATAVGTAFFLFVGFEWVAPMARSVQIGRAHV